MNKEISSGLAWAGAMLALALGAVVARRYGVVEPDTVTRLVIGANGLWMAWYGNRIPKSIAPSAEARRAQRVAGWAMLLSGLVYALLWMAAPIPVAVAAGCGAVLAGIGVTLGYCLSLRARPKAH